MEFYRFDTWGISYAVFTLRMGIGYKFFVAAVNQL
jgi:hypothetical protein